MLLGITLALMGTALAAQSSRRAAPTALGKLWHTMPAKNGAPGFKYQIVAEDANVRFLLAVDPALDLSQWSVHAWFGDPRVATRLQSRLASLHEAMASQQRLAQDPRYQDPQCQARIHTFLDSAQEAEARWRAYDAFHQVIYRFAGETPAGSWALGQARLIEKPLEKGRIGFEGTYDIGHHFDLADLRLGALAYHFALVPATEGHALPIGDAVPHVLALEKPLNVEGDTSQPFPLLRALNVDSSELFLATPEGYVPSQPRLLRRQPCVDTEPPLTVPGDWAPLTLREVAMPEASTVPLSLWSCGPQLALSWKGEEIYTPLALDHPLAGQAELGWSVLDLQSGGEGTTLLLKVESRSRSETTPDPCGTSTETELVWVAWDLQHKVSMLQHVLVESCHESLLSQSGTSDAEWVFLDVRRKRLVRIQFDRTRPHLGLTRTEEDQTPE
jgi:hypothetical protein